MKGVSSIEKDVMSFFAKIQSNLKNKTDELALNLQWGLMEATPVDTSAALSNWQLTIRETNNATLDAKVLGRDGYTAQASMRANNADAKRSLSFREYGVPVFIFNNIHYLDALNNGSSVQAPKLFIEETLLKIMGKN